MSPAKKMSAVVALFGYWLRSPLKKRKAGLRWYISLASVGNKFTNLVMQSSELSTWKKMSFVELCSITTSENQQGSGLSITLV